MSIDEKVVLEVYQKQAAEHGLEPTSTMLDQITRQMEVSAILSCLSYLQSQKGLPLNILEVGCGNGYLLQLIRSRFPQSQLTGVDYSPEMVALASDRDIDNCTVRQGNARSLDLQDSTFDVAVTERCLINLLDRTAQNEAIRSIHRVLKSGGHELLIEAFMDGLKNLNRARSELGLAENVVPHHNLWFDKSQFLTSVEPLFDVITDDELRGNGLPTSNFLSSHYFISRVLYPSITKREVLYNTEFVQFFTFLPPMGAYSPIQFFLLRKQWRSRESRLPEAFR